MHKRNHRRQRAPSSNLRPWLWFWSILLFCGTAHGVQPEARPITLQECPSLALADNPDIQVARLEPVIARLELDADCGWYDPVFRVVARESYVATPSNFDPTCPRDKTRFQHGSDLRSCPTSCVARIEL